MAPKILKCDCPHPFQDKTYGNGMRVHNPTGKAGGKEEGKKFRCTVCKKEK